MSRLGPPVSGRAKRPTSYCTNPACCATFRRRRDATRPCEHCKSRVTVNPDEAPTPPQARRRVVADYERHAMVIAGAGTEWTEERITAALRAAREDAQR